MMSAADEEPQIGSLLMPNSNSNGNIKLASLNPLSNTNSLISDSFNLVKPLSSLALVPPPATLPTSVTSGSKNSSASPSPSILPPVNHFQPIHNRAPSTDINNAANFFNQSAKPTGGIEPTSAASFFDKPSSLAPASLPSFVTAANNSKSPSPASLIAPPAAMPPPKLPGELPGPPVPGLAGLSNLPPPSMIQPPVSLPPPPPSAGAASTGSNPYSARGALNKKVYDSTVVPVASTAVNPSAMAFMSANTLTSSVSQPANLFVPPPVAAGPTLTPEISQAPPFVPTMAGPMTSPPPPPSAASFTNTMPTSNSYNNFSQPMANLSVADSFQIPTQSYEQPMYNPPNNADPQNKTMWNWLTQNKIVNTFVEKAKHGVESIVTTVDPQMKDYIHPANKPINMVAASSNMKLLHKVREQFNDAGFSKLSLNYYDANTSTQFAPQIVGYACALQACKEKLDNTLMYLQQTQQQQADSVVISFQDFLAELSTDCWFELAVVMFKDKANNIDFTIYTEAFPISNEDIAQLQMYTAQDYNLKWSGFSCRLPEKNFNFNSSNQCTVLNYDTPDTILSLGRVSHAVKSLAGLYKNKLLSLSAPK